MPHTATSSVSLYVDGACTGNPGPGGYAALIIDGGTETQVIGGYRRTTNNRMELMAVIAGLAALPRPSTVTVFCDSLYVVKAMTRGWVHRWKARGWMRTPRERALNIDLWERLLALCQRHDVRFQWVRGHADDERNNVCDELARTAAAADALPVDTPFEALEPLTLL
ncbi:MAG: ribonuclease HI [Gemmatimonadales bacterium]